MKKRKTTNIKKFNIKQGESVTILFPDITPDLGCYKKVRKHSTRNEVSITEIILKGGKNNNE